MIDYHTIAEAMIAAIGAAVLLWISQGAYKLAVFHLKKRPRIENPRFRASAPLSGRAVQFLIRAKDLATCVEIKVYREKSWLEWEQIPGNGRYGLIQRDHFRRGRVEYLEDKTEYQLPFPPNDHPDGKYKLVIVTNHGKAKIVFHTKDMLR